MTAVVTQDREVSYEDLRARAARISTGLDKAGIGAGANVALMLRNDIPFIEVSLATAALGAIPTPINWHWKGDEVGYLLENSATKVLVVHSDLLAQVSGVIPKGVEVIVVPTPPALAEIYRVPAAVARVPPGQTDYDGWVAAHDPWTADPRPSPGSMIYTSGTTGRPKGVERRAPNPDQAQRTLLMIMTIFGLAPGARTVIPAPMYHSAPNAYTLASAALGVYQILMPRFEPVEFLETIEKHALTHVQVVPTMFIRLLHLPEDVRNRYDLSSLEFVVHAAAPCPVEVKKAMIEWWGPVIYEYYGCTESGAVTFCDSEQWLAHPGTVGTAIEHGEVRIYRPDATPAPEGESGDVYLALRGATEFTYRGDDAKRQSIGRDGLITCGDIGYLDGDGFLYLNDRRNDMVISGGVNIYPAEIEATLLAHAAVADCAVFGIPDDDFGEALAAYIQPLPGATVDKDDIRAFVRERMAAYKVPKVVEVRDELPREDSGKIFKKLLRAPYWEGRDRAI